MTVVENRYLAGNFGPVQDEVTAFDLPVHGELPAELDGRFIRNGPNPVGDVDPAKYHWFSGNGMIHGLRLRDGKAEWFRNRFVRGQATYEQLGESAPEDPFGGERTLGAPNTNVIGHAGQTLAIVEGGSVPIALTDELDTVGYHDFGGTLPYSFSAHPHRDPVSGALHTVAYWWGWGNQVQYVRVAADGTVDRVVDVPTTGSPMVHDMAFTDRYILILDLPTAFDLDAAKAGSRFPYTWQDDYPARVGLLPRDGGADDVVWVDIDPCYVFHPLNAYDDADGNVVLDAVRHPKMFASKKLGPDEGKPVLARWTLDPRTGRSSEFTISDRLQEFPRQNEELFGKYNRYGYAVGSGENRAPDALMKHDLETGETLTHERDGVRHLEGVFIPREGAAAEDDGWIMAYAYDGATDSGEVVVIDAQDFTAPPVARVELPQRVPFGFHGNWVPTA